MQQAIYNSTTIGDITINGNSIALPAAGTVKTTPAARRTSLARRFARRWDMVGVVALMGSSAAYAVFAIAHAF